MTNESQPLDQRAQALADLRALIDYLAARPDVPLNQWTDPLSVSVGVDFPDDQQGLAEVARIAAALGVPVTDRHGRPPTETTTQYAAIFAIGRAEYRAVYITRESTGAYHVEKQAIDERRTCGCGAKLTDADLIAGRKRCAACAPGEAVESTPAPVLHIRQIGGSQHGLCGEIGGEATHASAATCPRCVAVLVEAEPKFVGRTAVES